MFDERNNHPSVGKTRVAKCSIKLKREPIDQWIGRITGRTILSGHWIGMGRGHYGLPILSGPKHPTRDVAFRSTRSPYVDNCLIEAKVGGARIRTARL